MIRISSFLALLAAAVLALGACGTGEEDLGSDPPTTSAPESSASETAETTPSAEKTPSGVVPTDDSPTEATDGTDYDACYDGTCEVVVTEGTEIAFDSEFRIDVLLIEDVSEDSVSVASDGVWSQFGPGGCGYVNGLGLTLRSIADGEAIMAFYPAVDCA